MAPLLSVKNCSLCSHDSTELKLLPCLHRYCTDCLDGVIGREHKTSMKCPVCTNECEIPIGGAGGFRTEQDASVVEIKGIKNKGWQVWDMTSLEGDRIVLTGIASRQYSFISVVNFDGGILRQDKMKKAQGSRLSQYPIRRCSRLSQNHIATVCMSGEIGVYNVLDGSYIKKNLRDIAIAGSPDLDCITTDPASKTIYVGCKFRSTNIDVLVFDRKLNYLRTVRLPGVVRQAWDLAVHNGHLLVCDRDGKRSYAVTMGGSDAKPVYEFINPTHGGDDWLPYRVCTDSNGYIYMSWEEVKTGRWKKILTQYSQDGRQLLLTVPVADASTGLCTSFTSRGEKLALATWKTGQIYTHDIVT